MTCEPKCVKHAVSLSENFFLLVTCVSIVQFSFSTDRKTLPQINVYMTIAHSGVHKRGATLANYDLLNLSGMLAELVLRASQCETQSAESTQREF